MEVAIFIPAMYPRGKILTDQRVISGVTGPGITAPAPKQFFYIQTPP